MRIGFEWQEEHRKLQKSPITYDSAAINRYVPFIARLDIIIYCHAGFDEQVNDILSVNWLSNVTIMVTLIAIIGNIET